MSQFQVHTKETASKGAAELLAAAGFTKAQVLEVILGISFKTLSNYVNHIAETPLDGAFAAQTWTPVTNPVAC